MRLPAIALFVILIAAAPAFAHFSVTVPEKTINVPTEGSRDVLLTIGSSFDDGFALNLLDGKTWTALGTTFVRVKAGEPQDVVLTVAPTDDVQLGLYKVVFVAESITTREREQGDIYIAVAKGELIDVEKILVFGDTEPTGTVRLATHVKNYKPVPANSIVVTTTVASPSATIATYTDIINRIGTGETAIINKTFTLPAGAEGGTYRIDVTIGDGAEIRDVTQTFAVATKPILVTAAETAPLLFGFMKTITVRNDGNMIAENVPITAAVSDVEGVFFSGDAPVSREGGSYAWLATDLAPGDTHVVRYSIDYAPFFLFVIAVIILLWYIFFKMRTVRIKKYIMQRKDIEEGAEFTVGVEVTNAAGRTFENLTVTDLIPPVFTLVSTQSPEPKKKKTAAGTELTWELPSVHHREERLLSYKIAPIIGVHGTIRLPRAAVTFPWNKRTLTNRSLFATIGVSSDDRVPSAKKRK